MSSLDVDQVADLIREVADRLIVPRFRALADGDVREKAKGDVVTVADIEVEHEIGRALSGLVPGVPVLGEEAAAADGTLTARVLTADRYWLLDPLDGTSNFVAGDADIGTMLALVDGGRTVASWIWQPIHQVMYVAEAGSGAFRDGGRIVVPPTRPWVPQRAIGYTRTSFFDRRTAARIVAASAGLGGVTPGPRAACITYPRLATRAADFALFGRLHPWDHAPGALLVAETGGAARRFDGGAYRADEEGMGLLIAADADHWSAIAETLGIGDLPAS